MAEADRFTVEVRGLKEFMRDAAHADPVLRKAVRNELGKSGEVIRMEASRLFNRYSSYSASRYRVRVKQTSVTVEQSLRKTTGLHPEWGKLQMRKALLPALYDKQAEVLESLSAALVKVDELFNNNIQ